MNNIEDNSNKYCTGCGACVSVCPVGAIEYKLNEQGFYQAFIDKEKCIKCGKCKKVCAKFANIEGNEIRKGKLISARSKKEEILKTTTSGGIAYELAKYGIENGYKVFGTIYDYKENIAKAVIAQTEEKLEYIKGSKYIQSNSKEAIEQLIKECKADENAKFIVFGTPCQITGIAKLIELNKIKNEIIKVDLFCHGVPSYLVWNKYLEQVKTKNKLGDLQKCNFRSKHYGWHQFCIELVDEKEKSLYINGEKSEFYKIFFDNMMLNKSCYNCEARMDKSYADIRLGDYWGKRHYNNQTGISAVVTLTEKGEQAINNLKKVIEIIESNDIEDCLSSQSVEKYENAELNKKILDDKELRHKNLKSIIEEYRKNLSIRKRIKLKIKGLMGKISPKCKYHFKKIYYKIKG